jgi:dTMP kinase
MKRAPFLSLDGLDGTGKSTQCRLLVDWLNSAGVRAIACTDPGGTPLGERLRKILLELRGAHIEPGLRAEAMLFMASRAELVARVIEPALEAGTVVVSDRFLLANVAYQGHAGGLDPVELWQVGRVATGGVEPDLTLVLDLPLDVAAQRRKRDEDRMESRGAAYQERVRQGFLAEARAHPDRFRIIDAAPSIDALHQRIRIEVAPWLRQRGIAVEEPTSQ